jgi:hypothetical protein
MATWTTPITWTNGAVTASQFNSQFRDNLTWLKGAFTQLGVTSDSAKAKITPALVGARVNKSSDTTLTNNTVTTMLFDAERFDSDAFHSTSVNTGRLTIPSGMGGYYQLGGTLEYAANSTGRRQCRIKRNGANLIAAQSVAADSVTIVQVHSLSLLAATDYVELEGYQDSGGSLVVNALADYTPEFWIHRLSST